MTEEEGKIEVKYKVVLGVSPRCFEVLSHLNVVVSVVVEVEHPVELGVNSDPQVVGVLDPLAQRLPGILLHLDVVELPADKVV